jgi:predicted RNA binding protein YcfA (HicA-like mRNA interferase family)
MPELPRWTAAQIRSVPVLAAFEHLRSKGSHRIYGNRQFRVTVPFHGRAILHPKTIKQVLAIIADAAETHSG